jgi:hypothetical protein
MGLYEYLGSRSIAGKIHELTMGDEFYSLLMAAMRFADTDNTEKIKREWPNLYEEFRKRYSAPGGTLDAEEMERVMAMYNS